MLDGVDRPFDGDLVVALGDYPEGPARLEDDLALASGQGRLVQRSRTIEVGPIFEHVHGCGHLIGFAEPLVVAMNFDVEARNADGGPVRNWIRSLECRRRAD